MWHNNIRVPVATPAPTPAFAASGMVGCVSSVLFEHVDGLSMRSMLETAGAVVVCPIRP